MISPAVEDYLKAMYKLSPEGGSVSTSAIAERLGIAAGSVTGMLKRLADQGLVEHTRYYGARLTPEGIDYAVKTIRRHRVLELFIVRILGYTWDRVHEEAERLEHVVTDEMIDRMADVLGEPAEDPHGAPIPTTGETFHETRYPALTEIGAGQVAVLRRVSDENPEALRRLARMKLVPGVELEVVRRAGADGSLTVRVSGERRVIKRALAETLRVEPLDD